MWSSTSRGDSGFCRDAIMHWCERQGIDYVIGLAKNARLMKEIAEELKAAEAESVRTGEMARIFKNLRYQTVEKTWSRTRRVSGGNEGVFWESDLKARSTVPRAELSALKTRDNSADNSNAPPFLPGTGQKLGCERWVMSRRARGSMTTQRVNTLHPHVENHVKSSLSLFRIF